MSKVVIITGAGGALGKAVVKKFIAEGFEVIATVSPGKQLDYSVEGKMLVHPVDLSDENDVKQFIESITKKHATIDGCICIAGGFATGDLEQTDGKLLSKMMSINFDTAYHIVRQVYKKMTEQKKGRIILVGSKLGMKAELGKKMIAYTLSKSLIFRLSEILNASASTTGVKSVVVVPDTIDTPANRKAMPNADFNAWTLPEKIAEVMLQIISGNENKSVLEI
ncbi:MAG: SDR family NAD(P)-dependent oxidoreductase [Flammeovirgaceae bacterium]|nr:SDR family NAD(P)-dependent oxidoreductase [Flammeovirgaceae bacterium]